MGAVTLRIGALAGRSGLPVDIIRDDERSGDEFGAPDPARIASALREVGR